MTRFDVTVDTDVHAGRRSRREALRWLGGMGLAAAGLSAARAETQAATTAIANALLEIAVTGPPVIGPATAQGRGQERADRVIGPPPIFESAEIRVTATINFTGADLKAMRQGRKYLLVCEVWENDDNFVTTIDPPIDTLVFAFPRKVYGKRNTPLPSRQEPVLFATTVRRSTLDVDTPNPNGDEIIARLILTKPTGEVVTATTNLVKLCPCQP